MRLEHPIKTPRLVLRDVVRHDLETIVPWLNDKALMRYSSQRFKDHTPATQQRYLYGFNGTPDYYVAAIDLNLVGTATLYVDTNERTGHLGLLVGVAGQRYGEEIYRGLIGFAFETLGLRKVTDGTLAIHRGQRRILESLGFSLEGVQVDQCLVDGAPVDVVLYGLPRSRWKP